jgi:hypothetical protein
MDLVAETTPMKSSYLTNLVLLAIVIALLWLSQRNEPEQNSTPRLSTMTADSVTQIQIDRQDKVSIQLQRQGENWQLSAPFKARANQTRVNLLLSLLSSPIHSQFQAVDPQSLAQFGLDAPKLKLTMNDQAFIFGDVESLSQHRYILYQGMIYLVQEDVSPLLNATPGSFVDNRLLNENATISKLRLPQGKDKTEPIQIELDAGHWRSNAEGLSSDKLQTLVDSWQHAYAMQVHYIDDARLATLPEPQIEVWLNGEMQPMRFILMRRNESLQLINPSQHLLYDFPLALQTQLLPQSQTTP